MLNISHKRISKKLQKKLDCTFVYQAVEKFKVHDISLVMETEQNLGHAKNLTSYTVKVYCGEEILYITPKKTHDVATVNDAIGYISENLDAKITLKIIEKLND